MSAVVHLDLNEFECLRKIGCGAFGQVFQARLRKTNEVVAVKETFQDPKFAVTQDVFKP